MIVLGDKKYACESCIKGHRSSACKHTDRALFEIKKKGRPVTQCEHCRELRKTQQVHVKCLCGEKAAAVSAVTTAATAPSAAPGGRDSPVTVSSASAPSTPEPGVGVGAPQSLSRGGSGGSAFGKAKPRRPPKPLPSATFPNGISVDALEASVALQILAEGADDEGCNCAIAGSCDCCTPRKRASRRTDSFKIDKDGVRIASGKSGDRPPSPSSTGGPSGSTSTKPHFRPVLPRPAGAPPSAAAQAVHKAPSPPARAQSTAGDVAAPLASSARARRASQAQAGNRGALLYSPYGRAYEQHAQAQEGLPVPITMASLAGQSALDLDIDLDIDLIPSPGPLPLGFAPFDGQGQALVYSNGTWDLPPTLPPGATQVPPGADADVGLALCGCGATCACTGCVEHDGHAQHLHGQSDAQGQAQGASVCADPANCGVCLQCTINSIPATIAIAAGGDVDAGMAYDYDYDYAGGAYGYPALAETEADADVDAATARSIDEWLREVSAQPTAPGVGAAFDLPAALPDTEHKLDMAYPQQPPEQEHAQEHRSCCAPSVRAPGLAPTLPPAPAHRSPGDSCGARGCQCPPGRCACFGHGPRLTFATSGERRACCSGYGSGAASEASAPSASRAPSEASASASSRRSSPAARSVGEGLRSTGSIGSAAERARAPPFDPVFSASMQFF